MDAVLIVKNISRESPGLLERVLKDYDISFDVVDLSRGEAFPKSSYYKAVVVLGGPDSANDTSEKMIAEIEQIKIILDAGIPYLGICLGLQTLVKAAGGVIVTSTAKEIGFMSPEGSKYAVERTVAGKADPLLTNLPDSLDVFQLHGEAVELTDSMTLLGSGRYCHNQIIKVTDKAYGIQSHFELTPEMLAVWAANDPDLVPLGNGRLQADFTAIHESYTRIGETLMQNFLRIASLL
jgi:GMP synthase (glutamine-hydrolysing)